MSNVRVAAVLVALALCSPPLRADVVVNEILHEAPDQLDKLQFVELHNAGKKAVDLSGWKLVGPASYRFPAKATLAAGGYLVLCKDHKEFKKHYGADAFAQFEGTLGRGKGSVGLLDAADKRVDSVKYASRGRWPVSTDGHGSSLERICPTAPGSRPGSWAPSPLPDRSTKPGGTPGKKNSRHAAHVLPAIGNVKFTPASVGTDQTIHVEAGVSNYLKLPLEVVELRYRVAGPGYEKEEQTIRMSRGTKKATYTAKIPAQQAGQIVRFRIRAVDANKGERFYPDPHDLRPALSVYVHEPFKPGKVPFGLIINVGAEEHKHGMRVGVTRFGAAPAANPPARGRSAFVWVDAKTGTVRLFDFISISPRTGGRKLRFHKDRPLNGMTTVNLIYEYHDRFILAEPLAYEVYRRAGNAAPRTEFVRTWIDGQPIGFQLLIEQPNKAFLRHNRLRADGNLYKRQWAARTVVEHHEKKSNRHGGHADVVELIEKLGKVKGDEQWKLIQQHFDVEQVINYFAVNMVLSHWDGFFNNYFAYHDVHGSKKWTLYPWDQDKTWGYHDGIRGYEVFTDMPITFGMANDRPPGYPKFLAPPAMFGIGVPTWWRPGGHFSSPLLANPTFRKHFLARTKEILETVYTEEVFLPLIRALGERIEDEVRERARLRKEDPKVALERLRRNLDSLRDHLKKRRAFLLAQDEIKKAGKFDRAAVK